LALEITDIQGWVVVFAIIGGLIGVLTAGWRVINFLRTETKEAAAILKEETKQAVDNEHEYNAEQHTETRKVVRDALQGVDDKFEDIKTEVSRISDIRVEVAVHNEKLARHDDALKYLNRLVDHKIKREENGDK
jgi:hypothetical protein